MEEIDVVIIGAGVTGLACGKFVAARGHSVCLIERHPRPGAETSTHNSGVIHAGMYYPAGALKTRLCVEGRPLLYEFCRERRIEHRRSGKLVVATLETEVPGLEALHARGEANGVERLQIVDRTFIAKREPNIRAIAGLFSPDTGIVDADGLVRSLLAAAREEGAIFLPGTSIVSADRSASAILVRTGSETIVARQVINAAGLYADEVSHLLGGESFTIYPCRGEYAELAMSKRSLVSGPVYPLPHSGGHGLGVHLTPSTAGNVWIGPTTRYQQRKDDYEHDRLPLEAFVEPTRALLPDITLADLRLSGSGIRPKLHPPAESFADFIIRRDTRNPRLIQAAGIESPGLTACLAIGRMIANLVDEFA
ncbi:MAG TPA: NAD(P)/FAD-dependent oxidoreductase [Vicinamibacterales bacterium]|nr:NAD(P)/FAD-dependent oxidoreductase [Vicinamibacterales bacterium]